MLVYVLITSTFGRAIRDYERDTTRTTMQLQGLLQETFVDEFRRAYDSSRDGLSDGQPNSTLALVPTTLVTARPTAIHHVASLFELGLTIAACFLETYYV